MWDVEGGRINDQYRICFVWRDTDPHEVEIVNERRGITADTAYRLSVHFGTSADLWMNLQSTYELACVERDMAVKIKSEVQRRAA